MKRLSVILITIFAVFVLSNCSSPAGSIDSSGNGNGNGNNGSDYDSMWVIPNRLFYESGEKFIREYDLNIFSADKGIVRKVDPAEPGVQITISETSAFGDPKNPVVVNSPLPLTFPGIYRVEVLYNNKDARYTFEVRGYYNPEGDGSGFIDIIWL